MAVDPLTAKILAKVAVQAATDSESRKRILFMILAPVLGLLLLIAFILYLIMVLRGVTSEGKILVADPASKKRSEQEWDISIILDEARKGAAAGGPLWAIY